MKANQATYPVRVMSRLLGVSASGFYAWKERPLSKRAVEDIALTAKIQAIHLRSSDAYGAPSIHAETGSLPRTKRRFRIPRDDRTVAR